MTGTENYIVVDHVSRTFTDAVQSLEVLRDIDFQMKKGEFVCIVGGSGCGKSTLLRAISGLDSCHEGQVTIDGEVITKPGKKRGFVFQENRLFPWLSVRENIKFALDTGTNREKNDKADEVIRLVSLTGFENSLPRALSGGMAQRVNIARALVNDPPVLFLDEPFGALDAFTKMQLQDELINIKHERGTTMLMVTHDIDEAIYLSNRIIVMGKNPGVIRDIIKVDLPRPRDRNNEYFVRIRKKIYEYFFATAQVWEDYSI